jgi:N-acyl-D-amino-acid deacylase
MHDLIIRNAQVFDGSGLPAVMGDVAVSGGCITHIGQVEGDARETIDAQGLALMPGIVDLHTHYDAQVTWDRTLSPSPALGVTTAVIGNCGFGIAPCPAPLRETMLKNLSVVEGMDLQSLLTGVNWEFESFGQYMDQLRRIGPYINTAVFAGHSVIRTSVMGAEGSTQAEPTPAQLQEMQALVREAMDQGAIGFASSFSPNHSGYGGIPMPSTIASEAELRALTGVLGEQNKGIFMMATGSRATPDVMESIVENTGRPAYISTVLSMYTVSYTHLRAHETG